MEQLWVIVAIETMQVQRTILYSTGARAYEYLSRSTSRLDNVIEIFNETKNTHRIGLGNDDNFEMKL